MNEEHQSASRVTVELTVQEWVNITKLLYELSKGDLVSINKPEVALRIRDRIVRQLPEDCESND